jgi:cell division GTPase FtsZ
MSKVESYEKTKKMSKTRIEQQNKKLEELLMEDAKSKLDPAVLAKLKSKMGVAEESDEASEEFYQAPTDDVSINFSILGVGQAGSRIAETFFKYGYSVGVINTSSQDLKFIDIPDDRKLLLNGSLGGTGKDLDLGREIFEANEDYVDHFISKIMSSCDMSYLAISGGGGTGSSSVDTMVNLMYSSGSPVGVIYILPKETEDAQSKANSIQTLARLAEMASSNILSNLIVVDNARIEQIYGGLSQAKFWDVSNKAIVEPLHVFNNLTATPSKHTSLDPSDFAKIVSVGDCSVYGVIEVEDYMEETSLAEAVIESLSSNMLAEGFDLKQTRVGGVIITGTKKVLDKLPAININYCYHMISEATNGASIFQGVYDVHTKSDSVKIYTWFGGLGLPRERIESLKKESEEQSAIAEEKEKQRAGSMTLDLGVDKTKSVSAEINRKIKKKKSNFGRLQGTSIVDRRRRK